MHVYNIYDIYYISVNNFHNKSISLDICRGSPLQAHTNSYINIVVAFKAKGF